MNVKRLAVAAAAIASSMLLTACGEGGEGRGDPSSVSASLRPLPGVPPGQSGSCGQGPESECREAHGGRRNEVDQCMSAGEIESAVYVQTFDRATLVGWTAGCNADQFDRVPDICGTPEIDRGEFFCSPPASLHLFSRASCLDPPFDGLSATASTTLSLPNGPYRLDYAARNQTYHYFFCQGGTSGDTHVVVNGVTSARVGCGVNQCRECLVDWTRESVSFEVTDGTAEITVVVEAGDCAEVNGWVDDLVITPAE